MPRSSIVVICAVFAANLALAQDITGEWTSQFGDTRVYLKFTRDRGDKLTCGLLLAVHTPVMYGCTAVSFNDLKLNLNAACQGALKLSFNGTVSNDGSSITGILEAGPARNRLEFHRTGRTPTSTASPSQPSVPAAEAPQPPAPTAESSELLDRALKKLAGTGLQLQKYTCLETVERRYFSPSASATRSDVMTEAPPPSCGSRTLGNNSHLQLTGEDRLRLQAAVAGNGREIDSWASASSFDSRSIVDLVPTGAKITGIFGTSLVNIFENSGARFAFLSYKIEDGRVLLSYSFEVPLEASRYRVHTLDGWETTAYRGTFEIDSSTADLVRVVAETTGVPQDPEACLYRTSTNYHYQPIGGGQYLIPLDSNFEVLMPNGDEDHGMMAFSGCHEYGAESSVSFGEGTPVSAGQAASKTAPPLPDGLSLTLALVSAIDSRTASGGDAITAKVSEAVRAPGSRDIVVAKGAIVHGRFLQARQDFVTGQFLICIRYDTLEQNGTVAPLALRLASQLKAEQLKKRELSTRGTEFALPPPAAESGTWFTLGARDGHATLAAGYETTWVTVAQ